MTPRADSVSRSQYVWMYASNALALVSGLLVYHLAGSRFGTEGFAEYALARRATNLLAPALMLGMGIALPRQIAVLSDVERAKAGRIFLVVFTWVSAACAVLAAVGLAAPRFLAALALGDESMVKMVGPLLLFLTGLSWHSSVWAYCRGTFHFRAASMLDMCNLGIVPIVAFLVAGRSPASLLTFVGVANGLVALAVGSRWLRPGVVSWQRTSGTLMRYGLPRVPGDFALGAMLALPSLAIARVAGISEAGHVAFGNTMLALAGTAVAPFSAILLPQSSRMIADGRLDELRTQVWRSLLTMGGLACIGLLVAEVGMSFIVEHYLGAEFLVGVRNLRLLALCVLPYITYCLLRSVIDGAYQEAVNAWNAYAATAVMAIGAGLAVWRGDGPEVIIGVTIASHFLLGLLTLRTVVRLFNGSRPPTRIDGDRIGHAAVGTVPNRIRVLSVIPGAPEGSSMIFARRQSASIGREGAEVRDFFVAERMNPIGVARELRRLVAAVREYNPHILHAHYGTVTAVLTVAGAGRRPVVITFRGSDLNASSSVSLLRNLAGRWLSQMAALRATRIVCVSQRLRDRLWWRRNDVLVLPSGVDTSLFRHRDRSAARAELGLTPEAPLIVFNCGRDPWVKNLDLAEAALVEVRRRVTGAELIVMRGDWLPEKVPLLLSAADCLLVTSRQEGSPNIVREALATGLPVVSVDVGDVADRISGIPGCRVCATDAVDIGNAVADVVLSGARVDAGAMVEQYSEVAVARRLLAVYEAAVLENELLPATESRPSVAGEELA